jgi:transketolase
MIPNLYVFRPADGMETAASYLAALELKKSPSALLFTRQNLPPLEGSRSANFDDILKGGYVVHDTPGADTGIVATGSEVWVAIEVAKSLNSKGKKIRVVSLPCVELFMNQSAAYRENVLPASFKKVSLESGITMGWREIVGANGLCLGIDHYGASAPADRLADEFGFTPKKVEEKVSAWLR